MSVLAGTLRKTGAHVPPHIPDHYEVDSLTAEKMTQHGLLLDIRARLAALEAKLSPQPPHSLDLTRAQAAAFLNYSLPTFDRKRAAHPDALAPSDSKPLRWSREKLELFRITRGVSQQGRNRRAA